MSSGRCDIPDPSDATAAPGASASAAAGSSPDGSPMPRFGGNYTGFLPDAIVNQLDASAASGSGLSLMQGENRPAGGNSGLLLLLLAVGLVALNSSGRSR